MTERIKKLKAKLFNMDDRTVFLERLFLMRKAYEKHRDRAPSALYALVLEEILAGMSIVIDPDDLIAGRIRESVPTEVDEHAIREIAEYYSRVCPEAVRGHQTHIEDWAFAGRNAGQPGNGFQAAAKPVWFSTSGHITVSWETLLSEGMSGVREKAGRSAERIGGSDPEKEKKLEFLEAVTVSCNAVIAFAERYAEAVERYAEDERNPERREELRLMGRILKRVPAYPATTFREALQSVWLLDLIMHQVCGSRDYTPGRMDQYLYDYYRKDIERGLMTRDDAIELLQNFFIHTVEISGLGDHTHGSDHFHYTTTAPVKRSLCKDSVQYLVLAGQTPQGLDACNELSSVILDAMDGVRTKSPDIVIRYHKAIDRDFWLKACEISARGLNNIGVYNDDPVIAAFVNGGVRSEDAVNYSHYGCCNPAIPGKDAQIRENQRNLVKILELALNDGYDPVADFQRGPHTGRVEEIGSFDELMAALKVQLDADVVRTIERNEARYTEYFHSKPFSFESCLLEGCVEEATDCNDPKRNPAMGGSGYIHFTMLGGGLATAADSLAAIKKAVFEDGELTLAELKNTLDANYDGQEMFRLKLMNKYPKFGNDDDYVDSIASDIAGAYCKSVHDNGKNRPHLGLCWPLLYTYHRYRSCGLETGATPDGRAAFEPVSENQSPVNGRDVKGVSALINSLSKLKTSFAYTPGGGLTINMHPTALTAGKGAKVIADLHETYFEKGGLYIQLNVIDRDTLIEAKNHPEKHRDLLVRVTGYSAYFVTLSPESQDNIIARYAHSA